MDILQILGVVDATGYNVIVTTITIYYNIFTICRDIFIYAFYKFHT